MIHTQLCRLTLELDPSTLDGSMRTLDPLDVTTGDHRLDYSRPPSTPSTLDPPRRTLDVPSTYPRRTLDTLDGTLDPSTPGLNSVLSASRRSFRRLPSGLVDTGFV